MNILQKKKLMKSNVVYCDTDHQSDCPLFAMQPSVSHI